MREGNNKNINLSASMVLAGIILFLLSGQSPTDLAETEVTRNNPGKGAERLELEAIVDDIRVDGIDVRVEERNYTPEECKKLFEDCREELIKAVLNDNSDLKTVTKDLRFEETLKGYPFSFEYETDSPDKIGSDGEIITDKPFTAIIRIKGSYGDFEDSYAVRVKAKPQDDIKRRVYKHKIISMLSEIGQNPESVTLPTEVDGKSVKYRTAEKGREPAFLLLGIVAAAAVLIGAARDEKVKRKAYKKAILKEYPTVLKKISLYLSSGMNLRNIWQAVYEEGVKKKGKENPFYKEMGVSLNELSSGISEGLVYTRFGERIKEPEIIRFTALLSQNLKKGSSRLKELLNEEAGKAFMAKKQRAVKEGEEAGTKMLIPMMLLLIDVMIIIVIPAFRGI